MSWQVITDLDVDRKEAVRVMERYGFFPLRPNTVTRMEERNGLLCHRDPELCWVSAGPEEIPEGFLDEPLIIEVLKSPKVELA